MPGATAPAFSSGRKPGCSGPDTDPVPAERLGPAAIQIEEVTDRLLLGRYRAEWDALVTRDPESSPFQSYDWVTLWLRFHWQHRPIRFLLLRRDLNLIALAPFMVDREGFTWCPGSLVHKNRLLCAGDPIAALEGILAHLRGGSGSSRIVFRSFPVPLREPLLSLAREHGFHAASFPAERNPAVVTGGDWTPYLLSRPAHLRHELQRKLGRAERSFSLEFACASSPRHWSGAMKDVLCIERACWKDAKGSSLLSQRALRRFYAYYTRRSAQVGSLRIYILRLDGRPAAYVLGTIHKSVFYAFKTSYDAAFKAYSPGSILFQHAIERASAEGLRAFNLLGDETRWKKDLANELHDFVHVCNFSGPQLRCRWCTFKSGRLRSLLKRHFPLLAEALKSASWSRRLAPGPRPKDG